MILSKRLRSNLSFESVRKQAKKLVHQVAANDPDALARVQSLSLPISLRDAQLIVAREYGFGGWKDLRTAVLRRKGSGLEWAAAEAERAIHDNKVHRLRELIGEYPALISWRSDTGDTLLSEAASSFGDSGDPRREQTFTRLECAEFLLDAGATLRPEIWEHAIRARAKNLLQLFENKGALPRRLDVCAALGDSEGVRERLDTDQETLIEALYCACRFGHKALAALILNRCIELDPTLGERIHQWRGPSDFIDYLVENSKTYANPWLTIVMNELHEAINRDNRPEFLEWLQRDSNLLDTSLRVELIEHSVWANRGAFITSLLQLRPALPSVKTSAMEFAFEYGNAHLVPLLTPIWPLPNDLPHAAGIGDLMQVKSWFDEAGQPRLGALSQHYPTNNPHVLKNLRWSPPNTQQVLDVALAWACMNHHFEIASYLLERGADINTDWSTHEPASMLHECAMRGDYEAARFLIDRGIDVTILDYRWNATAEGWAIHAAKDEKMAKLLESARSSQ
jgi:hypothetical protein